MNAVRLGTALWYVGRFPLELLPFMAGRCFFLHGDAVSGPLPRGRTNNRAVATRVDACSPSILCKGARVCGFDDHLQFMHGTVPPCCTVCQPSINRPIPGVRCATKAGRTVQSVQVLLPEEDFPSPDGRHPLKVAIVRV